MNNLNPNRKQFEGLIDSAIAIAMDEAAKNIAAKDSYNLAVKNLRLLKENFLKGIIGPSNGSNLGLGDNIGEFDNGILQEIAYRIDDFYRKNL